MTGTDLHAFNHETGLRARIVVPFDRSAAVQVEHLGAAPTEFQAATVARAARFLVEERSRGASACTLDDGTHVHFGFLWS